MAKRSSSYLAAIAVLGPVGALFFTWWSAETLRSPATFGVLAGIAVITSLAPVRVARSGGTLGFTLEGGAFTAMLLSGYAAFAPATFVAVSLVSHAARTRDARKAAFNTGRSGLETTSAALVYMHLAPAGVGPTEGRAVVAMIVAAVVFEVVSIAVLTELFHRMADAPRLEAARDVGELSLVTLAGNAGYGLIVAAVASVSLAVALLAGLLMPVIYLGYRGYATALAGQRRADALNEMTHVLLDVVNSDDGPGHVLIRLVEVFGARRGCIVVETRAGLSMWEVDGASVMTSLASHLPRTGLLAEAMARGEGIVGRDLSEDENVDALAAPILHQGNPVGAVAVYERVGVEGWDEADSRLLAAIANELAVALDNVSLFRQVEEERARLEAESTKLNNILGAATDGISSFLSDGTIEAWNPGMARITGVSAEAAIGRPWHAVLRLKDGAGVDLAPRGDHMVAQALDGDFSVEPLSLQVLRADGVWRLLQCTASPVRDPDGQHRGVVVVARDVTTERELEDLKADFISTVSHELRTPLTPLKGFLATLRNPRTALTEEQLASIHGSMSTQLTRLETLISDLLAVAELDHGQFNLYPEPLALGELIPEAVEVEAADQFLRCTVTIDPEARAVADSVALVRVVRSLVSNAVKHTEGSVEVMVRAVGERVEIAVADEGPGIASWDQQRVFNRFERLGNHLRRTQGPGLGLTIARTLAQRMGGDVSVSSDIGRGAVFTLSLPRARPRAVEAAPAVSGLDRVDETTS